MAKNKLFQTVQTAPVLNNAVSQAFGKTEITTLDAKGIIDLGNLILKDDKNKNAFIKSLTNVALKTVFRILDNKVEIPNILVNGSDYFQALRKISVKVMQAKDDSSNDLSTNTMWRITIPETTEKIFGTCQPFVFEVTIPDKLLEPAFNGEILLDDFVVAVFDTLYKSIIEYANALVKLAISNFIVEKVKANRGVIPLVTLYNSEVLSEGDTPIPTGQKAMFNRSFLAYASMVLSNYIGYLEGTSVLFNDGTIERATQRDNLHVLILQDFASATKTFLEADTFNKELVSLPMYVEVKNWQGTGNTLPTFSNNSTINMIPSSEYEEEEPTVVTVNNVIATMFDRETVACSIFEDWSATDRNNRQRYTNYTFGANRGYYNDLSENGVVFTLN